MTCFNFFQKGVKAGTIEVRTAVPIVRKMPDISHTMLTGIFFKVHFLVLDTVGFSDLFIISGQSLIQRCDFDFFFLCHGFNLPSLCTFISCDAPFLYRLQV